jgi:hypothetical protein
MLNQASFDFTGPPPPPPGEVEILTAYLKKQGPVWTPAKQIEADLGINDRKLRILRAAAKNQILSGPGCPGYRHMDHATLDNIQEAAARKRSQIRAMTRDYIDLKRCAHSRIR